MDPITLGAIGLGGSVLSSVVGGIFGGKDAREAERQQRELIRQAQERFGMARGAIDDAEGLAIQSIDDANLVLAGVEPALLEGLDETLRVRVAQAMQRQSQEAAQLNQRLAAAGLDSTTVMPGVQRQQRQSQADSIGALTANFGAMRAQAIAGARQGQAQGLFSRANALSQFGAQRANVFGQEANFLGGVQVQGANTGAAIGQIGGALFGGLSQFAGMQQQQNSNQQLADVLRGLGGPAPTAPRTGWVPGMWGN